MLAGLAILAIAPALAFSQGADTVVVIWTAPGDDGRIGTAAAYDLRISEAPITEANFSSATAVSTVPRPLPSGTRQGVTVRGLERGTVYYFAIRTVDDAGNWSGISNLLRWDWTFDTSPPAAPTGLSAQVESGKVRLRWSASAEADLGGYRVYRARSPGGPYVALNESLLDTPEYLDSGVPEDVDGVWYQVTAFDVSGNESARTAPVAVVLRVTVTESVIEPGYPNPSRGATPVRIPVVIPPAGVTRAVVDVLDSGGRRVRRIELNDLSPGRQEVMWDGRNDAGREVAPGVYRGWLIAGGARSSIRLVRVP